MDGGTYTFGASYDADTRLSSLSVSNTSTSAVLFQSQRGYDAASNVTAVATTLSAGTDNQAFCYDDQNRLVWAGSTGTPSCGASLTAGSLSSANYTQSFSYDTLDRLTNGPLGSYTYGDSAHLHGVTSIGSGPTYTAMYDAVGDMTCRAPDNTTTCASAPTGAQLGYDNEGRLATWQNAPSSPTTTDSFLYDGAGNRVEQQVTINGSITTTTIYVADGHEEITSGGAGTTLTKYFAVGDGLPTAERVGTNGPVSLLTSDGLGSLSEALDSSGNVTFQQLYAPYGVGRYSSGSSPTALGYTGQREDGTTGLDYYHARYYDPVGGQFGSADTADDGLNRYGYVHGNPTTATDPTGHRCFTGDGSVCGGPGSSPLPPIPTTCHSDASCGCYTLCSSKTICNLGLPTQGCNNGPTLGAGGVRSGGHEQTNAISFSDKRYLFRGPEQHGDDGQWHVNVQIFSAEGQELHNYHIFYGGDHAGNNCSEVAWVQGFDTGAYASEDIEGENRFFYGPQGPEPYPATCAFGAEIAAWDATGKIAQENDIPGIMPDLARFLITSFAELCALGDEYKGNKG